MTKTETWVQQYRPPPSPGPDGMPRRDEPWYPSDLGLQFRGSSPYIDRYTSDGRKWRRYIDKGWAKGEMFPEYYP